MTTIKSNSISKIHCASELFYICLFTQESWIEDNPFFFKTMMIKLSERTE